MNVYQSGKSTKKNKEVIAIKIRIVPTSGEEQVVCDWAGTHGSFGLQVGLFYLVVTQPRWWLFHL
jgi:hypothetical protein